MYTCISRFDIFNLNYKKIIFKIIIYLHLYYDLNVFHAFYIRLNEACLSDLRANRKLKSFRK